MDAYIKKSQINGTYTAPSSKSILHRALLCFLISDYKSCEIKINNFELSNDIKDTINVLNAFEVSVDIKDNYLIVKKNKDIKTIKKVSINILESATTLRLIIPVLYALEIEFCIHAKPSLLVRPLDEYIRIFNNDKAIFKLSSNYIYGKGMISCDNYIIDGSKTSQFASGMLLAFAILKKGYLKITNLQSKDYVELTISMLKRFQIIFIRKDNYLLYDKSLQVNELSMINIEGDYTQSFNFFVLGLINAEMLKVEGLDEYSMQGDCTFYKTFKNYFGVNDFIFSRKLDKEINNLVFDIKDSPDLGPILMVLLLFFGGKIINCERLIYKESNRIDAMLNNLKRVNADVSYDGNTIYVNKYQFNNDINTTLYEFDSFNDHRICMALSILCTMLKNSKIINIECINKSYPNFFLDLKNIGCNLEIK